MASTPPSHPLGPLDFAVTVAQALLATALVVFSLLAVLDDDWSIAGVGQHQVCATSRPGVVPFPQTGGGPGGRGLHPDASRHTETVQVCVEDPPAGVIAAGSLRVAATFLFPLAALLLTSRLIRHARRTRIFSLGVAVRTRQLGWFLGLGSLLAAAATVVSDGLVLSHAVPRESWTVGIATFDFPWLLLIVAFAVITVGRVLEWAVVVQEEVDATV